MFKDMPRDEAIDWLLEQAAIHYDGDEANAHAMATEFSPGFATPETVMQASGQFLKDNELGFRYPNILDVPCGMYATTNQWFKNGQITQTGDGAIIKLIVMAEHAQRKLLIYCEGYGGELYVWRTHGSNDYNSPGWRKFTTTFPLFEGSASGVGTTINLKDSMRKYSTMKLFISGWGGQVFETQSTTGPYLSFCNVYDTSPGMEMYEMRLERVTDTQYRIARSDRQHISASGVVVRTPNTPITISKIEGVK
ncbi:hypothetical protein GVL14_13790 [Enterococcus mundtii]|nr:hypothetical protein [Enterococcus mundtii]